MWLIDYILAKHSWWKRLHLGSSLILHCSALESRQSNLSHQLRLTCCNWFLELSTLRCNAMAKCAPFEDMNILIVIELTSRIKQALIVYLLIFLGSQINCIRSSIWNHVIDVSFFLQFSNYSMMRCIITPSLENWCKLSLIALIHRHPSTILLGTSCWHFVNPILHIPSCWHFANPILHISRRASFPPMWPCILAWHIATLWSMIISNCSEKSWNPFHSVSCSLHRCDLASYMTPCYP